jgi:pimeloyl-ACP methyl ester carboxylesterase
MFKAQRAGKAAPNIVLVHGAWTDGSSWREVIALLQQRGLEVTAVQNRLVSFADDVKGVTRIIERQTARVVLVGHDYGGTVITQAGNNPKVAALVYIAAFAPDVGESTNDVQSYPPRLSKVQFDTAGFAYLAPDTFTEYFAQDLPAVESRVLAAAQVPIHADILNEKITTPAWRKKPVWYLLTGQDRMIDPRLQRELVARTKAKVMAIEASHVPFLSTPIETTATIVAAAEAMAIQ